MEKLYNVVGLYDLEGLTFARCTTLKKAEEAKELLEAHGFENVLEIQQDGISIDTVEIGGKLIPLP